MNLTNRTFAAEIYLAVLLTPLAIVPRSLQAQSTCWTGSGPVTTNCSVGIGTSSPAHTLDVNGSVNAAGGFSGNQAGGGIAVYGSSSNQMQMLFQSSTGNKTYVQFGPPSLLAELDGESNGDFNLTFSGEAYGVVNAVRSGAVSNTLVLKSGSVGIGITNPTSKLAVDGNISATEVVVTSTPSDYVFDQTYRLAPLSEVATYIKENHHLPGIPPGPEVEAKGISVGDMQSKLLAKIEELTLHMIQAEERNNRLEQQVKDLRDQLARLSRATESKAK
jgi:hypothetical protein